MRLLALKISRSIFRQSDFGKHQTLNKKKLERRNESEIRIAEQIVNAFWKSFTLICLINIGAHDPSHLQRAN